MRGKIAVEEHFALPGQPLPFIKADGVKLLDIFQRRLAAMDNSDIAVMALSLTCPGVQGVNSARAAVELAARANDYLAEQLQQGRGRFRALAALPMHDPREASKELTRCIEQLGFHGCLVNGYSPVNGRSGLSYYDEPDYWSFWYTVEQLGVPFYLHPRNPPHSQQQGYELHPWLLGPAWAFGVEAATHALRLMASGLFDRFPRLRVILGHMGEGLPSAMWRIDQRIRKAPRGIKAKRPLSEYLRTNFYITTSGVFHTPALLSALRELGADRILFAIDYPFEDIDEASSWFDRADLSERDRMKICEANAKLLFGL